jgi:xanthine dehydrogenase YagS FAD-binding subunit
VLAVHGRRCIRFEKVRDRHVWDFPLVNVASAPRMSGGSMTDMRSVGAVAATPWRVKAAERAVMGKQRTE